MTENTLDPRITFPATPTGVPALDERLAPEHPLTLLQGWLAEVLERKAVEPYYVTLATSSLDGTPSSRTVQLLAVEDGALLFTTNFGSRKGVEMRETGRAAVSLFWRETAQSVNITGHVVEADDAENDARFAADLRSVQASRTVSFHGLPLDDEEAQLAAFRALADSTDPIPRPPHWRWFRIVPDAVTFWEGHPEALNRRLHYSLVDGQWRHGAIHA